MYRFLVIILANVLGIWLADRLVSGFDFSGRALELVGAGTILAVLNWIVRPLVKLLTGPLVVITLGLFLVVINGFILWILDQLVPALTISGVAALALATLIMTALNIIVSPFKKVFKNRS